MVSDARRKEIARDLDRQIEAQLWAKRHPDDAADGLKLGASAHAAELAEQRAWVAGLIDHRFGDFVEAAGTALGQSRQELREEIKAAIAQAKSEIIAEIGAMLAAKDQQGTGARQVEESAPLSPPSPAWIGLA